MHTHQIGLPAQCTIASMESMFLDQISERTVDQKMFPRKGLTLWFALGETGLDRPH